jgi:glycosyltransferase involved in cell wall biosynthesis
MRVLYFSRSYNTHDLRFLKALAKTEHQISYLNLESRGQRYDDLAIPAKVDQIQWVGGRSHANLWNGGRYLGDLKRVIREVKPDLIQAGPLQTVAFLVALAGFQPLVSMSWGYDLLHDANRNALWRWATKYTLRHSAVMVGDCKTIRQKATAFGMPNERIITFPWGVDLERFKPSMDETHDDEQIKGYKAKESQLRYRLGWGDDDFVLLSTRPWEPLYGVEILVRAFSKVARDLPQLRLLMLGDGSQAVIISDLFQEEGVMDRVHFAGQVSQADLPDYYRAADLYISASHSDGTSISLLEAMACGRPVLVSDIPGNREWVVPGEQGWWFRDGEIESLAEAISTAVDERQRLPEMGKAAYQLARQRGDWKTNFPVLLKAYDLARLRIDAM